jgi:hypothetical protein
MNAQTYLNQKFMTEPSDIKPERVIRVGPDQVTVTDNEVVIETKHEMPDWEVQTMNTPAIYFEDKKYLLVEKGEARRPYLIRYVLQPWPAGKTANARVFHTYDAAAVAERDSSRRGEVLNEAGWACLLPFYPFLGLLWSGTQQRLVRFGYLPRTITGISIFTIFGLMLSQGAFIAMLLIASARSGKMMIGGMIRAFMNQNYLQIGSANVPVAVFDVLLGFVFLADVCMRYSHYLREDQWCGGFFEWLVPQSLRKNKY